MIWKRVQDSTVGHYQEKRIILWSVILIILTPRRQEDQTKDQEMKTKLWLAKKQQSLLPFLTLEGVWSILWRFFVFVFMFCLYSVIIMRWSCFISVHLSQTGLIWCNSARLSVVNAKPSCGCQTRAWQHPRPTWQLLFSFSKAMYLHFIELERHGKHWEKNK